MVDTLITTYLEMTHFSEFVPAFLEETRDLKILTMEVPDLEFYQFLYQTVGEPWRWRDRLQLSEVELKTILSHPGLSIDVAYWQGIPAGYIELERVSTSTGISTQIAYFGLRQRFTGKGLGKHLLSHGIAKAWEQGTDRIWVHTCNLDSIYALENYQKRGFKVYQVVEELLAELYQ